MTARIMPNLYLATLWALALPAWGASAEYALRWDPGQGGPQDAQAVLQLLGLKDDKPKVFLIRYFSVKQPAGLPAGFAVIARQRETGETTEASYKLRGPKPLGKLPKAYRWACPLAAAAADQDERDITWLARPAGQPDAGSLPVRTVYSRTCSTAAKLLDSLPASHQPRAPGCETSMKRFKDKGVKVEVWSMPQGAQILEVSFKVDDDKAPARLAFEQGRVRPLLAAGAVPLQENKTQLNSCP